MLYSRTFVHLAVVAAAVVVAGCAAPDDGALPYAADGGYYGTAYGAAVSPPYGSGYGPPPYWYGEPYWATGGPAYVWQPPPPPPVVVAPEQAAPPAAGRQQAQAAPESRPERSEPATAGQLSQVPSRRPSSGVSESPRGGAIFPPPSSAPPVSPAPVSPPPVSFPAVRAPSPTPPAGMPPPAAAPAARAPAGGQEGGTGKVK